MEIFELMLDEAGLGNRPSRPHIGIREVLQRKSSVEVLANAGICLHMLAYAGTLGGPGEWRVPR